MSEADALKAICTLLDKMEAVCRNEGMWTMDDDDTLELLVSRLAVFDDISKMLVEAKRIQWKWR